MEIKLYSTIIRKQYPQLSAHSMHTRAHYYTFTVYDYIKKDGNLVSGRNYIKRYIMGIVFNTLNLTD